MNFARAKCGKGKLFDHFAFAKSLARRVCLTQKLGFSLKGRLCFGGLFITALAWVDS